MLELQTEVSHLRRLLLSKDEEVNTLKANLTGREAEYKNQFLALKTDLNMAQTELTRLVTSFFMYNLFVFMHTIYGCCCGRCDRLKVGRSAVAVANEKADGVLAAALARAREETAGESDSLLVIQLNVLY